MSETQDAITGESDARGGLRIGPAQWRDLLALSLCWGCSFLFFKVLSASWPPFTIVLGRTGVAALVLFAVMATAGQRLPRDRKLWGQFALMGLMNNVIPFSAAAAGIRHIPSALAAILNAATPFFTVLAAHALTRDEKLTGRGIAGMSIAAVGVLILVGPAALGSADHGSLEGQLLFLGGGMSTALAAVYARRFRGLPALQVATCQLTAGALIALPLVLAFDRPWHLPAPAAQTWLALLGIAALSSALAYVLYFRILAAAGAGASQLVTFIMPVVAVALGWLALGEQLPLRAYAAMLVIACGLLVIQRTLLQKLARVILRGR